MRDIGEGRRAPDHDDFVFHEQEAEQPPVRAILTAVLMLLGGSVLIGIGVLLLTGVIPTFYWRRGYSLCILGALPFIPGAYYSYIAYGAWKGYKDYSYKFVPSACVRV